LDVANSSGAAANAAAAARNTLANFLMKEIVPPGAGCQRKVEMS
jgi:hypothetical protein